ncbi:MAG: radical SAM family heme chaperone HemW [Bacillota bacterium]
MKEIGLYIHIPFCKSKCFYCDFNSYAGKEDQTEAYMEALLAELDMYQESDSLIYKTVFFGGGTPTFIHYEHIGRVMEKLSNRLRRGCEVTIECNPGTVDEESLKYYLKAGVNRLSIGLQAWQDDLLEGLGRAHRKEDFLRTLDIARRCGCKNISVDVMFGLPGQTPEMLEETIENIISLDVEHVSCYSLKLEEGTRLFEQYEKGMIKLCSDEDDRSMYHLVRKHLEVSGYVQYEISNFSKPGKECRHNIIYWSNMEYLGIGAGSHSKLGSKRFWNISNINEYIRAVSSHSFPVENYEIVSLKEEMWESIFLSLRLNEGLDIEAFNIKYETDFLKEHKRTIERLQEKGLVYISGNRLILTAKGMDLSNQVFIEF